MTTPKALTLALGLTIGLFASGSNAQTVRDDFYITNGQVNAQVAVGNTLYVGGSFTTAGPVTGSGVPIEVATGLAVPGFPRIDGQLTAALADGMGGWYLGGVFTRVGSESRSNLAHVLADFTLDPWAPNPNGQVRALALSGDTLHVGGDFTSISSTGRNRIAAISISTGAAMAWNPNANNTVRVFQRLGSTLIVGGSFTSIGGQTRNRIAALGVTTGLATTWNPNANSAVQALALSSDTLYVGGQFTTISGSTRNRIAMISTSTGIAFGWNPNANSQILALALDGGNLFAGGLFTTIGGQSRNRIAALSTTTGLASSWNPNSNSTVQALIANDDTLYVGGDFTTLAGQSRSRVAALSASTGSAMAWNPSAFGSVTVLAREGAVVLVGGNFNAVGGVARNNLAAFDLTTGAATDWNPNLNGTLATLLAVPGGLLAGGSFTSVGGQVRNALAAIDSSTGLATAWDPNASGSVSAIAVSGNTTYVGGLFTQVGGQPRSNLAAIDLTTGTATSWDPNADGQVLALESRVSHLYVGGNFTVIGGSARDFIAELDATTGLATAWNPAATGTVRTITATCDRVLVGGSFSNIGGQARNQIASLSPTTGLADSWNPDANGPVFSIVRAPGVIYVGGAILTIGGQSRNRLASLNPATGLATSWNPNANGTVRSIVAHAGMVYAGGSFTTVLGSASGNLAALTADTTLPCATITLASPPAPVGVVGESYGFATAASGGTAPYCYAVISGSLPAGLTLATDTGSLSGTPTTAGVYGFTIAATDHNGCSGGQSYSLVVLGSPVVSQVTPQGAGECLTPSQTCVTVPFILTRGEATPLHDIRVTFQIDPARLALCAGGPPSVSIRPGAWWSGLPNDSFHVTSLGGGSYTVDHVLVGAPCGVSTAGELFVLDVASLGINGAAAVTVTSVLARDCDGVPISVGPGAATSVNVLGTPITLLPASISGGLAGDAVSQALSTTAGTAPIAFAVTSGALPSGLTLAPSGLLSGSFAAAGTFNFTVTATDAGSCRGSRAYSITVTCPTLVITPTTLPDGAIGVAYAQSFSTVPGVAPITYDLSAGTLPPGLSLNSAGLLSGTPTASGISVFTVQATDSVGCVAPENRSLTIFAIPPSSTVAANTLNLCISSANPCVTVPIDYTRGEATPVRAMSITFQLDPAKLSLCTPAHPDSSIRPGALFTSQPSIVVQLTDLGSSRYRADLTVLGVPCGITTGGTALEIDVKSVAGDGTGAISVLSVLSRDCSNIPIPVMPGPQADLRILNTPITVLPPILPNGLAGATYSQALSTNSGLAPFTFALAAGALPLGLTLAPSGVLAGTPVATGTFGFTVSVTDVGGAPGSRVYSLTVSCQSIAVTPTDVPTGTVGIPYSEVLSAGPGAEPFTWSISAGTLPNGLTLSASTGEISGTPVVPGTGVFEVTATDAAGCNSNESYTLAVFADPAISMVSASTAGLCVSAVQPCVSVPFLFARGESAPARAISVTFQIDTTRLALCTPLSPSSSIQIGDWLSGYANQLLQVVALGGGSYRVDLVLLGSPCGPTTGGELFLADLQSIGPDGGAAIGVTSVVVRDCANIPLPCVVGPVASLSISHAAPPAIADLASTSITTGNAPGSTTAIQLTWSNPAPGTVSMYRAPFGSYPRYDEPGPVSPPSPAAAPGAPWAVVSTNALTGHLDFPPTRGFWHYVAFLTDSCGNRSLVSNFTTGSLNYHLGDVSNGATPGAGDNRVNNPDLSLLGAHYGISGSAITTAGVSYLDVGPTTDLSQIARPVTDQLIDFEDLMVFSGNYRVVSAPASRATPVVAGALAATTERLELNAPSLVEPGAEVSAQVKLSAAGNLRGFSAELLWDATVVELIALSSRGFVESQGGILLSPRAGVMDAALLGAPGAGMTGAGEVATLTFRVLREGDAAIRLARVLVRDPSNHALAPNAFAQASIAQLPTRTVLLAPWPNPSPGDATLAFALAESGPAELAIFSVDGRRVRTLTSGRREAGVHRVTWSGDDDAHHPVAPGVYFVRLAANGREFNRRLVHLR